jgi:hypothetical protein
LSKSQENHPEMPFTVQKKGIFKKKGIFAQPGHLA